MPEEAISPIEEVSRIKYKEKAFEWWGLSPDEARRITVSKPKELRDKRTTLKEAVNQFGIEPEPSCN